jgi:hypothetical protein
MKGCSRFANDRVSMKQTSRASRLLDTLLDSEDANADGRKCGGGLFRDSIVGD